jgi:hypothetical protein
MGKKAYRKKAKVYKVTVEEGEHADFEMVVRAVTLGKFVRLARLASDFDVEELKNQGTSVKEAQDAFEGMTELFEEFGKALVDWNLEAPVDPDKDGDDDEWIPVPVGVEGVNLQEFDFVMFLIGEWIGAMGGVPDALKAKPNDGENPDGEGSPERTLALVSQPLSNEQS